MCIRDSRNGGWKIKKDFEDYVFLARWGKNISRIMVFHLIKELGLRHRAAMGISQVSDAHAIIVSEETGGISVAYKGQFYLRLNAEELESLLTKES